MTDQCESKSDIVARVLKLIDNHPNSPVFFLKDQDVFDAVCARLTERENGSKGLSFWNRLIGRK